MFGRCEVDPVPEISALVERLAGEDRAGWPSAALSDRLLELTALAERVEAEVLRCVGQWDAAKTWAEDGALGPAAWLADRTPMTRPAAVRRARTARFAFRSARTGDALAAGDVPVTNVETMAALAARRHKAFDRDEAMLVEIARKLRPDAFVYAMRHWRSIVDDEESRDDANKAFERRFFRITDTLDGSKVDGFLDPEGAALVRAALGAIDRPDPTNGPVPPRSGGQRFADALVELAKESLARTKRGGRLPANIDAVIDVNVLQGADPIDLFGRGHEVGGTPVSLATIERLCCSTNIGRVIMRGKSEVLDLGRRSRFPTAPQFRALIRRDRHCQFPGCDRPPEWTDAHHLRHWLDGGNTDLDNLVLLCRRHHVLCHEGGWTLTRAPDGTIVLTEPAQRPPPGRGPPLILAA